MPIFSIIVPVYNCEKYLIKCIESILSQTFELFELILIDDGSIDNSGLICDQYSKKDARIKVLHTKNKGVSCARNLGLDISNGKYICFIDSDDYVEKDYIEKLYRTDVDIVVYNTNYINLQSRNQYNLKSKLMGKYLINEEIIENLIESRYISTVFAKMYKRSIIEKNKIRFNNKINIGEDTMFVVDYIVNSDSIFIDSSIIYNYIDYGLPSLSKFNSKKLFMLEYANNYIYNKLINRYEIEESISFKKRMWSLYRWAIFEIIKDENMNFNKKRKLLNYIYNAEYYRKILKDSHIYMKEESKLIIKILSIKKSTITILFFKLVKIKNKINNLY